MLMGNTFMVSIYERLLIIPPSLTMPSEGLTLVVSLLSFLKKLVNSIMLRPLGLLPIILNDATMGSMVDAWRVLDIRSVESASWVST